MTHWISQPQLKEAGHSVLRNHGGMEDLPQELANSIANAHYRFILCLGCMTTHLDVNVLTPYAGKLYGPQAIQTLIVLCHKASMKLKQVLSVLPPIRRVKTEQPDAFHLACKAMVDGLKYDIDYPTRKSDLRRWLERKLARVSEIPNLLSMMALPSAAPVIREVRLAQGDIKHVPSEYIPTVKNLTDRGMSPESAQVWRGLYEALDSTWYTLAEVAGVAGIPVPPRIPGYMPVIKGFSAHT